MKIVLLTLYLVAFSAFSFSQLVSIMSMEDQYEDQIHTLKDSLRLLDNRQIVLQNRMKASIKQTEFRCDSLEAIIYQGQNEIQAVQKDIEALKFRLVKLTNDHASDLQSLRNENLHLKKTNVVLFILIVLILAVFFIYFRYQDRQLEYRFDQRLLDLSLSTNRKLNNLKMKWKARFEKIKPPDKKKKKK